MPQIFEYLNGPMDGQTVFTDAKDVHWSFDGGHYQPVDGMEILAGHAADEDDMIFMMWKPDEEQPTRMINTCDELSAMNVGSIVHDTAGTRWELKYEPTHGAYWLSDRNEEADTPPLPATVVWEEAEV